VLEESASGVDRTTSAAEAAVSSVELYGAAEAAPFQSFFSSRPKPRAFKTSCHRLS
jgi:hypothetical protein